DGAGAGDTFRDAEKHGCFSARATWTYLCPVPEGVPRTGATPYGADASDAQRSVRPVTREDVAEAAEDGAFAARAALLRSGGVHAAGEAREGQRLQPHVPGPCERRQEHALAAEQHGLDAANAAHVHVHARGVADHAARVHVDALARRQLALGH